MKLDAKALAQVIGVLERIDDGLIPPRMPDRLGRFLRQYERGRGQLARALSLRQLEHGKLASLGRELGAIDIHPLEQPEVSILELPLGEVARVVAVSEQLGYPLSLAMWLKAVSANTAYNLLRRSPAIRLAGDYRWTPPGKLTTGTAEVETASETVSWQHARCLKAVADDIDRPPHALEYLVDYRHGPPGLKYFRSVCAMSVGGDLRVFPGVGAAKTLATAHLLTGVSIEPDVPHALLVYTEPWTSSWTVVEATRVTAGDVLAHAIAWADFQAELLEEVLAKQAICGAQEALQACGIGTPDIGRLRMARSLLPAARAVITSLRNLK